jgi:hypothetical protein
MDRVERELSKLDSGSPTTPQRSHIQNGSVVPGAGSTTNLGSKTHRNGSAKKRPTVFAPGGIELVPQPSSSPSDPLVRSLSTESRLSVADHAIELVTVEERMYFRLINLCRGTHMYIENHVRHSQCGDRYATQCHVSCGSSADWRALYLWRVCCFESSCSESVLGEEGALHIEREHGIVFYGVEYAYHGFLCGFHG